jgi:hypothetical protein
MTQECTIVQSLNIRYASWLACLVILLAGVAIRLAIACGDCLWLDELHTAWTTGADLDQVSTRALSGNQSPFYFWIVWLFRQALMWVSDADAGLILRSVSLLAGLGVCLAVATMVWRWTGSAMALVTAAWMVAVEPSLVFYSTEARPYALMQCLGVLQVACFWHWLNRFRVNAKLPTAPLVLDWSDCGLLVTSSAMMAIHVTSIWLPIAQAVFVGILTIHDWVKVRRREALTKAWLSATIMAVLSLLLVMPLLSGINHAWEQSENWQAISDRRRLLAEVQLPLRWAILMPAIGIGVSVLAERSHIRRSTVSQAPAQALHDSRTAIQEKLFLVGIWATLPYFGLWLLDYSSIAPAANNRYAQVGTVAFPLFASLAIGWMTRGWPRLTLTICVLLSSLILNPWLWPLAVTGEIPRLRSEDWGSPITEINQRTSGASQQILLFANLIEDRQALSNVDPAFQSFLRFPLFGVPEVKWDQDAIRVYPTLEFSGIRTSDLNRLRESGEAWIIIRGREPLVSEIVSTIAQQLNRESPGSYWYFEFGEFEQSPWSDVKLFRAKRF